MMRPQHDVRQDSKSVELERLERSMNTTVTRQPKFVITLTEQEAAALEAAANKVMAYSYATAPDEFALEARVQAATLPERLRRELLRFERWGNGSSGLLIRGLPLGEIPATPEIADNDQAPSLLAAAAAAVIASLLGAIVGYRPELGGKLMQSILPQRDAENSQRSVGSRKYLLDHIEMAFSENRSDFVVLCCVRADHDGIAGTLLSSVEDILPLLSSHTAEVLHQERFRTTVDESFLVGWGRKEPLWVDPIRVFDGPKERPRMRVDFAETQGTDPEATRALVELHEAELEARTIVRLRPGDVLITDNNHACHGRTPFTPCYDGHDRWLLRTFVTRDLERSAGVRPGDGRVIDPDYRMWLPDA